MDVSARVRRAFDGRGRGRARAVSRARRKPWSRCVLRGRGSAGGTPLFASPWRSYPPIEGIFLRGSERIGDWLAENRWERTWGYNDNFPDRRVVSEYEAWWQGQHPFYTSTAVAVRGGWHFVWPDDDWLERVDEELVLWTLSGEPWLEVWARAGGLQVLERTT